MVGAALLCVFEDRARPQFCLNFCRFGCRGVTAWVPAACGLGCFAAQKRPFCNAIRPVRLGNMALFARQNAA